MGSRVRIVQLDLATLRALAAGDLARARETSPAPLTGWLASPDCRGVWQRRARQLVETPADTPWVTGVLVDDDRGVAVGRAGFHGAPDPTGMVEVGYAVDPAYRRMSYARAGLAAMLGRARGEAAVRVVRACVAPTNTASLTLVREAGFVHVGEWWDEEDGLELVHELEVRGPG